MPTPVLPAVLLGLAAAQIAARVLGRPTWSARLLPRMDGGAPYLVWAMRLWPAFGLPALAALLLLGRAGAVATMPEEFDPAAAFVRRFVGAEVWSVLLGLLLGALIAWRRLRRGRGLASVGRPLRLPRSPGELPAAALLALSAGVAEELYFRLALPLLVALVSGSALLGFAVAAAAFGAVHRYQGPVGRLVTGLVALLLSAVYLGSGSLWLAMGCHAAIDLNALVVRPWLALKVGRDRVFTFAGLRARHGGHGIGESGMTMRGWMLAGAMLFGAAAARAQDPGPGGPIQYDVRFPNAALHEARITVTYRALRPGPVRFQMARSSPGRYALHEFAKNVYSVSATDGAGRALTVTRADPYGWSVAGHDGVVTVAYTLYGDRTDGTYAQIDGTHAHLNSPATFLWAAGYDERPIRVRFHAPDPRWKVATQLPDGREAGSFWAPNLQYFMDSPTELSDHGVREWRVAGGRTIRLAVHHAGSDAELDRFAAKAKRVIDRQLAIFGGPPRFDYGRYTVIADYLPGVAGDGMEHRNSTIVTGSTSLAAGDADQLQTVAHEFFHSWNVERIRPAELEPFDFTRANPTPSLWLAEGFTSYYGPMTVRRAGEQPIDAYLAELGGGLSAVLNAPARAYGGPKEMSLRAPFVDAARSIDPVNPHIFVSYYTYGAVVALALDLSIRDRFAGKSLDDFMRVLWRAHGEPERPYAPDDLRRALAEATGDQAFADAFFARSIDGSALPDMAPLLAPAGLLLRPARAGRAYLGAVRVAGGAGGVTLAEPPVPGSPLYLAGVERDDTIISLGGTAVTDAGGWTAALERSRPGERVELVFRRRGRERRATLVAVVDPTVEIVRMEAAGMPVTAGQRAFRTAWIGG